jgi:hypothetical protein
MRAGAVAATLLAGCLLLAGCVGSGRGEVTGSISVAPCSDDEASFADGSYSLDPDFFVCDFAHADFIDHGEADDSLSIHIQNGSDVTLRETDGLVFIIDDDQTRAVAEAVQAGGRSGATMDISPGGTVQANFRFYGTCPDLFGNFQGIGSITFSHFPAPPEKASDPFRVELGQRIAGSFELGTIVDLRGGSTIGSLSGYFDFTIARGSGSTLFP